MSDYKNGRHFYTEGRAYQGKEDPDHVGKEYTVRELEEIVQNRSMIGAPLYYEHKYERGEVGRIIKTYMDKEDPTWLCIGAQVFNDTKFHANVARALNERRLHSFSIGYAALPCKTHFKKRMLETSVTDDPDIEGAAIMVCHSKNKSEGEDKKSAFHFGNTAGVTFGTETKSTVATATTQPNTSSVGTIHKQLHRHRDHQHQHYRNNMSSTTDENSAAASSEMEVETPAEGPIVGSKRKHEETSDVSKVMTDEVFSELSKLKSDEERSKYLGTVLARTRSRLEEADQRTRDYDEKMERLRQFEEREQAELKAWQEEQKPIFEKDWEFAVKHGLLPDESNEAREERKIAYMEAYLNKNGGIISDMLKTAVNQHRELLKEKRGLEKVNKELACHTEELEARQAGFQASGHGLFDPQEQRAILVKHNRRSQMESARNFAREFAGSEPPAKRRRYNRSALSGAGGGYDDDDEDSFSGASLGRSSTSSSSRGEEGPRERLTQTTTTTTELVSDDMMRRFTGNGEREIHGAFMSGNPIVRSILERAGTRGFARKQGGLPPGVPRERYAEIAKRDTTHAQLKNDHAF